MVRMCVGTPVRRSRWSGWWTRSRASHWVCTTSSDPTRKCVDEGALHAQSSLSYPVFATSLTEYRFCWNSAGGCNPGDKMARYELLNNVAHKDLRVITRFGREFGDGVGMVPAYPTEYAELLREYPVFFRRDGKSGEYESVALLGFT